MHILSIDIGTRNFAWSLHDTETGEYTFKVQDLGKVKDYVKKMRELSSQEPFLSADVILVENQMRACMKTMATSLRCFHYDKTIPVAPQSIKRFFKTCMKSHHKNKKAGIIEARKYLSKKSVLLFNHYRKQDDLADCILQTEWYKQRNG